MIKTQSKWRSWGAWLATANLIFFVLQNYFDIKVADSEALLNLIYLVGMAWGIWNNPEKKGAY